MILTVHISHKKRVAGHKAVFTITKKSSQLIGHVQLLVHKTNLCFDLLCIFRVQKLFLCKQDEEQTPMKFYFGDFISCHDPETGEPVMKV